MKSVLFTLLVTFCVIINIARSERECRIYSNYNQEYQERHQISNRECQLHSRYDKISEDKLYCPDVCYIDRDYYNFNVSLFF